MWKRERERARGEAHCPDGIGNRVNRRVSRGTVEYALTRGESLAQMLACRLTCDDTCIWGEGRDGEGDSGDHPAAGGGHEDL